MQENTNQPQQGSPQGDPHGADQVTYKSSDGQFEVVIKTAEAWRDPKHGYPIVCLRLRPKPGTRIQDLRDGTVGLDVLLTHKEVAAHLSALNQADPKGGYKFNEVPEKDAARKARWRGINGRWWKRRE